MTRKIAAWRTVLVLRERRIDVLEKERADALRAWERSQAAHEAARKARQESSAACDAHDEGTRRMLAGEGGFRIGDYLDRQNYAPVLKTRLEQAALKMRAAADEERTRGASVDDLRMRIQRENARIAAQRDRLADEIRRQDKIRQEAEDEEVNEASEARRRLARSTASRRRAPA